LVFYQKIYFTTITGIYSLFTEKLLEPKCKVDTVCMDFRKAFNSIPHDYLLNKSKEIGIAGKL